MQIYIYENKIHIYEKYIVWGGRKKLCEVSPEPVFVLKHGVICTSL